MLSLLSSLTATQLRVDSCRRLLVRRLLGILALPSRIYINGDVEGVEDVGLFVLRALLASLTFCGECIKCCLEIFVSVYIYMVSSLSDHKHQTWVKQSIFSVSSNVKACAEL